MTNFWRRLYHIKIAPGEKLPYQAWGGYDQDFDEAENVYTREEAVDAEHPRWGYIDVVDDDKVLGILDLDFHKDDCPFDIDDFEASEDAIRHHIKTPSGGHHIPFTINADFDGELRVAQEFKDYVDLKGMLGKGHCVMPSGSVFVHHIGCESHENAPVSWKMTIPPMASRYPTISKV